MRILFGPAHDGLHISPDTPGAYEWWYFDALSDDGRFALVAIFFLGTPMSPYYKAVVDGKNPLPRDWCGVFFSLHEHVDGPATTVIGTKQPDEWLERLYAYNLYRGGDFAADGSQVIIGGSSVERSDEDGTTWELSLNEPGLWRGSASANVQFTTRTRLTEPDAGQDNGHSWVCVAPVCRVRFSCQMGQRIIRFSGNGYHDHNFGMLPWRDTEVWYWGRAQINSTTEEAFSVVYYADIAGATRESTSLLFFDAQGRMQRLESANITPHGTPMTLYRNVYGLRFAPVFTIASDPNGQRILSRPAGTGTLSKGPFYQRSPIRVSLIPNDGAPREIGDWDTGLGIGEVFRPARLCGPIASRAMWTRMRRRS